MADPSNRLDRGALAPVLALFGVWLGQRIAKGTVRERRLDQKLDIYRQLIRSVNEYSIFLIDLSDGYKFGSGVTKTIKKDASQIAEEFYAAFAVAPLFISEESCIVANKAWSEFFNHSTPFPVDIDAVDSTADKLTLVRLDLVRSAKQDLAGDWLAK